MNLSRFDWYQASFPEESRQTAVDVLGPLGDEVPRRIPGIRPYAVGWEIRREGSTLCRVFDAKDRNPDHVICTGADSPEVAARLRALVPGHRVARADVCLDFTEGPGLFADLRALMTARLEGSVTLQELTETAPTGQKASTLYAGARTSDVRVRLYEKGKQDTTYAPDTVRLELQARPKKDRKSYAASIEPDAYWGLSRWSRALVDSVCGLAAPAAPVRPERVSDLEGSLEACINQYGRRLAEWLVMLGGDRDAWADDLLRRIIERHG